MTISFTIVTPSLNQATYLEAAIQSVLRQDYRNLEYIVMDGGSQDESAEIIRSHSTRLAYFEIGPDAGQADAVARGFAKGTGEILGWLNSDDVLMPGALAHVGRYFSEHAGVACVIGGCVLIDASGNLLRGRLGIPRCQFGGHISLTRLLTVGCMGFHQPATFWRREAYAAVSGINTALSFSFDYDLYVRMAAAQQVFGWMPRVLAGFRVHSLSKTTTLSETMRREDAAITSLYPVPRGLALRRVYYTGSNHIIQRTGQIALMLRLCKL